MKKIILFVTLLPILSSASGIENFVGSYKLVKALKETERSISTRGSKCREKLDVYFSKDKNYVMLMGNSVNPFGSTMNWIELEEKSSNLTEISDNIIFQSRTGINTFGGAESKFSYDTKLELDQKILKISYQEKHERLLSDKMKIVNQSECIYSQE